MKRKGEGPGKVRGVNRTPGGRITGGGGQGLRGSGEWWREREAF